MTYHPLKSADYIKEMQDYARSLLNDQSQPVRELAAEVLQRAQDSALDTTVMASRQFTDKFVPNRLRETAYQIFADDRVAKPHRLEASLEYLALLEKQIQVTREALPQAVAA